MKDRNLLKEFCICREELARRTCMSKTTLYHFSKNKKISRENLEKIFDFLHQIADEIKLLTYKDMLKISHIKREKKKNNQTKKD